MARRSHHSIGEVLSLLQDDFPDITISKIRFLESQGLISPERTPSGYRRFFQRDLDLLRWILTQQRDHYLPLKVIREKLAAGEPEGLDADAPAEAERAGAGESEPAGEAAPPSSPQATIPAEGAAVPDGDAAAPEADAEAGDGGVGPSAGAGDAPDATGGTDTDTDGDTGADEAPTPLDDEVVGEAEAVVADEDADADDPGHADPEGAGVEGGVGDQARGGDQPASAGTTPAGDDVVEVLEASEAVGASEPGEPAGTGAVTTPEGEGIAPTPPAEEPVADGGPDATGTGGATPEGDAAEAAATGTTGSGSGGAAAGEPPPGDQDDVDVAGQAPVPEGGAARTRGAGSRPGRDVADTDGPGRRSASRGAARKAAAKAEDPAVVALTRDELAEASGCPVPVLNDLERFGLLQGKAVGRGVLYDGDALVVARLAARFANHGLEPRHLRSFRLAAEREIGLFAQVVGPLLQRRDAMAHERAMETLTDLASLASELHQVLVQNLVTREFGGR